MKIPKTLGRYEIVDLIGHGGMGSLFRARDPFIGRFVAIKLLRTEFDTPEVRDRFSREARAAGSLSHPNIVTIYDVGEDNGLPFIAMEFVRGETFEDLAGLRPPLPVTRKIQLIEEVCHGLAHAHEQGIVHRDIKPANLILGSEGIVKILDFGIAKLTASGMTVTGTIMGTLNYMSPEQITGASVDARADIFAVGAVFYELLSHQQAFPGNRPAELLHRIVSGSPKPVTDFCPDLDPRLVHVIDRALEKDPEDRFQDIASMQSELASIRLNAPPTQRSHEGKRMTRVGSETTPTAGSSSAPPRKTPRPIQGDLATLRARQIEAHLTAAENAFTAGEHDAAIEFCRQVLLLDDSDDRALSLIDRIHAEIDDQRPAAASKPEFDDADIAPTIRGPNPILRDLEERRLAAERAERLDRTLRDLDERLAQNDLAAAGGLLEAAVSIAPGDSRVQTVRGRLEQARAAAAAEARERNTREKLSEAQAHLEKGNLADAAAILKGVADVAPEHPAVLEFSERLRVATEQRAAAEAAERRQKQVRDLLQSASQKLASSSDQASELTIALQEVTEALTLDSENAEAGTLKTSIEAAIAARREEARVKTAIGNARSRFAIGKHQAALHLLEEFEPAGKPEIVSVLDELRKALHEIEEQRRLERERVERQERVSALTAAARTALRKQQFDTALEHLAKAAEADPTAPEIKTLSEEATAQRAAAHQREAKTEELLDDVEQRITAGDLIGADDVLRMAAHLSPANARVSALKQRHDAAMVAKREAEAQAREAEARAREAEARAREEEARAREEDVRAREEEVRAREAEARAREAQETISSAEQKLQAGDLEGAQALAKHATTLDPKLPGLESLVARVEAGLKAKEAADAEERTKRTVDELTAAASGMLDAVQQRPNDIMPAMQKIARALELSPTDPEAQSLKIRAEQIYNAQRQEAFVRAALGNARTRFAMGKHQAAFQLLESLDPAANPLVASTLAELREALRQIEAQKAAQAASPSPPQATPQQTNIDSSEIDIAAAATTRDSGSTTLHGSLPPLDAEAEEPRGRWDLVVLAIVGLLAVIAVLILLGMYGV